MNRVRYPYVPKGWHKTRFCCFASKIRLLYIADFLTGLTVVTFLANVNVLRYLFSICYEPSVCRLSVVCLSVCLSVTLAHPTKAVKLFGNFFSPYDSSGTLLFWCQKSLVGDAPFPLKFSYKVTDPPFKQRNFDQYRLIAPQPS